MMHAAIASEALAFVLDHSHATRATTLLLDLGALILRSSAMLCLGGCVARFWPRISAAQRHLAWTITCVMVMLVPLLKFVIPAWNVVVASTPAPVVAPALLYPADLSLLPVEAMTVPLPAVAALPVVKPAITPSTIALIVIATVWLVGTLITVVAFVRTHVRARRLVDETVPCDTPHVTHASRVAATALGVRTKVRVRYHATAMPFVYGIMRPVVVLPVSAAGWRSDRLRDVLRHELAHVARRDIVAQLVASSACAMYWFNPLVWIAARALRTEREIACDDRVLLAGALPSRYASHLLDLVDTLDVPSEASVAALAFARRAQIHTRLRSIIDPERSRVGVTRAGALGAIVITAIVGGPLMALTPTVRNEAPDTAMDASSVAPFLQPYIEDSPVNKHAAALLGASFLAAATAPLHAQEPEAIGFDAPSRDNEIAMLEQQLALLKATKAQDEARRTALRDMRQNQQKVDSLIRVLSQQRTKTAEQLRAAMRAQEDAMRRLQNLGGNLAWNVMPGTPGPVGGRYFSGVVTRGVPIDMNVLDDSATVRVELAPRRSGFNVQSGPTTVPFPSDMGEAIMNPDSIMISGPEMGQHIRLRGIRGGLVGDDHPGDPIVIVDGKRVDRGVPTISRRGGVRYQIDPNTIDKVEVLKGPNAIARYGPDADDGVIIIVTKKASKAASRNHPHTSPGLQNSDQ